MTTDRELDRILDDWLADGPSQVADRVVHDALLAVERTPQSRGALRLPRRLTMTRNGRLAAAAFAAIAVIAIGVGLLNLSHDRVAAPTISASLDVPSTAPTDRTVAPSPSPTASPTLAPSVAPTPIAAGSGSWTITGSTLQGGGYETATLLTDGKVLVAGGEGASGRNAASAGLYDPATGQWTATGSMHTARRGHVAVRLADGRVLVAGGWDLGKGQAFASAELYDPATGTWNETGSMSRSRYHPKATLLPDGRVLVTGGLISGGGETRGAELYDPRTGTWSLARSMTGPGAVTLLPNGKVLAWHGDSAELYDPQTGLWKSAVIPADAIGDSATALPDGTMLMLGGATFDKAELYDPVRDTWTPTAPPPTGRGPATPLKDGTVLVFGARGAARYDPGKATWTTVAAPPEAPGQFWYYNGIAIPLLDGRVLALVDGSAALFDPAGTP